MPIYQPPLVTDEIYHIFNRGVEKREIFLNEKDYFRIIHDLWEFNDENAALNTNFYLNAKHYRDTFSIIEGGAKAKETKKPIVEILCFSLMPNHFHLLLRQLIEGGISLFMRKLGGYPLYFNKKHNRVGPLWQGRFKRVRVSSNEQLAHLVCYIHSNSLELWKHNWKEKKLSKSEIKEALKFLEKYRWSSHLDYLGIKNFPSLISKEFLLEFFNGTEGYKKFFIDWLGQYEKNINSIQELILE